MVATSGGFATAAAIPRARLVLLPGMGHDFPPARQERCFPCSQAKCISTEHPFRGGWVPPSFTPGTCMGLFEVRAYPGPHKTKGSRLILDRRAMHHTPEPLVRPAREFLHRRSTTTKIEQEVRMEFKFLLPAKVVMGPDLRERTGEYLRELGMAHVLIVTDAG